VNANIHTIPNQVKKICFAAILPQAGGVRVFKMGNMFGSEKTMKRT
jgi:hypothetical protein